MKKFTTVLALALLAPMLSACAPSPEDMCEHVFGIMKKELGDAFTMSDEDLKKAKEECVKEAGKEKEKIGAMEYKKQAKCVMEATKLEELDKCDKKHEDVIAGDFEVEFNHGCAAGRDEGGLHIGEWCAGK